MMILAYRSEQDLRTAFAVMVGIVIYIFVCIFIIALNEYFNKPPKE